MKEGENLKQGNISIVLDSYQDIFSSFDPREYSERALSDDFLSECKKAINSHKEDEQIELRFLMPKSQRNFLDEAKIKRRLKNHAFKRYHESLKEIKALRREGVTWFFIGALFISLAAVFYGLEGFIFNFLEILLTPAGWFTFWEGLGKVFIISREKVPDQEMYKKFTEAKISFQDY